MEQNIDNFSIDDALGFVVNRASIMIRKHLTCSLKQAGIDLTPEEFAILCRLWEEDKLFQSVINDKTLKDKTTVTRLLERLINKGLVEKAIDEGDRRNFRIFLTEKGIELKSSTIPVMISLMETASFNINCEDLRITINTLKTIFDNLNREP